MFQNTVQATKGLFLWRIVVICPLVKVTVEFFEHSRHRVWSPGKQFDIQDETQGTFFSTCSSWTWLVRAKNASKVIGGNSEIQGKKWTGLHVLGNLPRGQMTRVSVSEWHPTTGRLFCLYLFISSHMNGLLYLPPLNDWVIVATKSIELA